MLKLWKNLQNFLLQIDEKGGKQPEQEEMALLMLMCYYEEKLSGGVSSDYVKEKRTSIMYGENVGSILQQWIWICWYLSLTIKLFVFSNKIFIQQEGTRIILQKYQIICFEFSIAVEGF